MAWIRIILDGEVLTLTNTDVYAPTLDYHPSTKKYVDDLTSTYYLKLNQSSPQTIANGVPLMTTAVDIDGSDNQLVNKAYVDTALLGLELTEFFGTVASVVSDGLGGYYKIMDNTVQAAGTNTGGALTTGDNQYYRGYITPVGAPNLTTLYAGVYGVRAKLYKTGTKSVTIYFKLYQRTVGGTENLIATSETTSALTTSATVYEMDAYLSSNFTLDPTDRLVLKAYANVGASGSDITVKIDVGGTTSSGMTIKTPAIDAEALSTAISFTCIAGETLKKGQAVYISGASSGLPQVSKADNTSSSKCCVVGCVTEDLASSAVGKVRRTGTLVSVDTRATNTDINPNGETWVAGNLLFATTGGGMTNVRPTSGRSVKAGYSLTGSGATDTILVYAFENPVWATCGVDESVILRLGDSLGTQKVSIRNYTNNEVASISSDGEILTGGLPVYPALDQDNFSSNSDTRVPTQQSTKAYVDSKITTGTLTAGFSIIFIPSSTGLYYDDTNHDVRIRTSVADAGDNILITQGFDWRNNSLLISA